MLSNVSEPFSPVPLENQVSSPTRNRRKSQSRLILKGLIEEEAEEIESKISKSGGRKRSDSSNSNNSRSRRLSGANDSFNM